MDDEAVRRVHAPARIFFEGQRVERCGLRALNNILQAPTFAAAELNFLGYKINAQGIHPLGYKLKAIVECKKPTTQKQLLKYG